MGSAACIAFLFIFVLSVAGSTDVTFIMMKRIGIEKNRYPQCYIVPRRWLKKFFKIKQKMIPKFIHIEFYIIVAFALLFLVNLAVYSRNGEKDVIILYNIILFSVNIAYIVIGTVVFRRKL